MKKFQGNENSIDYTQLDLLLAGGKWKEASQETYRLIGQIVDKGEGGMSLQDEDIDNFPCEDLRTMNQMWLHYSNGKFGFSVQKEIYLSVGGTRNYYQEAWEKFCDRVGWRKNGQWLSYSYETNDLNLTYNLDAPPGHLPFLGLANNSQLLHVDCNL